MKKNLIEKTDRREFLGSLATGAVALGLGGVAAPQNLNANPVDAMQDRFSPGGLVQFH